MLHGPGRPHPLSASYTFLWQLRSTIVASHHIKQNYPRGSSAPDATYTFTLYYDLIPARTDIICFYHFLRNGRVSYDSISSYPVSRKGKDLAHYHDVLRTGIIKMYLRHSFVCMDCIVFRGESSRHRLDSDPALPQNTDREPRGPRGPTLRGLAQKEELP